MYKFEIKLYITITNKIMDKFINHIYQREYSAGYKLFNKKRLYEICGCHENYKSNNTPFCPRNIRLFLTSEYCDLSKVIPEKEDIKFIMMNTNLKEEYVKKYIDVIVDYLNEINASTWFFKEHGSMKFNPLSERQFINIWREVNTNVAWNTIDEEGIIIYMILTINNIIKFSKSILNKHIPELEHFNDSCVLTIFNQVKKEYYNPLIDENYPESRKKFNNLKNELEELIQKTYSEDSKYTELLKLFNDMDYSYRFHETILDFENFSIKLYISQRANPEMITHTKKDLFWRWDGILERDDITINFIKNNRDIIDSHHSSKWLWAKISEASYITNNIIIDNLDLPWKWQHVIKNENLTLDLFDKLPKNITHQDWVWRHLSCIKCLTEDFVKKHNDKSWSWADLILNPCISRKFIKDNCNKIISEKIYISPCAFIPKLADKIFDLEIDVDYHLLSNNYHLSYDIIKKYENHNWEWADLLGRTLSKDIILRFYHSMPESIKSSMFKRVSDTASLYPIPGQISAEYIEYEKIRHIKALRISRFFRDILYNPKYESARRNINKIYEDD